MAGLERLLFLLARWRLADLVAGKARAALAVAVNGVRLTLGTLILLVVVAQVSALALVGALVSALWLWGGENKLVILFAGSSLLFVFGAALGGYLLSERRWLRMAGAEASADRR